MKILFIYNSLINDKVIKHYFLDKFVFLGHEVQLVSCSKMLIYQQRENFEANVSLPGDVYQPINNEGLLTHITFIKPTICILELPFNLNTYRIFKYLKSEGIITISIDFYSSYKKFLLGFSDDTYGKRHMGYLLSLRWFDILKNYLESKRVQYLKKRYYKVLEYHTGSVSGDKSINSIDVENWKKHKFLSYSSKKPQAVFLDNYMPSHPDFKRSKTRLNMKDYYGKINQFFDNLEKKLNIEVVIAAHPKSIYSYEYGKRRVVFDDLINLVRNCSFAICHYSMSINICILEKKPIVFYYHSDFNKNFVNYVKTLSSYFNMPLSNENETMFDFNFNINESYEKYKKEILMSNSGKSNFDIINDDLNELNFYNPGI